MPFINMIIFPVPASTINVYTQQIGAWGTVGEVRKSGLITVNAISGDESKDLSLSF